MTSNISNIWIIDTDNTDNRTMLASTYIPLIFYLTVYLLTQPESHNITVKESWVKSMAYSIIGQTKNVRWLEMLSRTRLEAKRVKTSWHNNCKVYDWGVNFTIWVMNHTLASIIINLLPTHRKSEHWASLCSSVFAWFCTMHVSVVHNVKKENGLTLKPLFLPSHSDNIWQRGAGGPRAAH